MILSVLLTDVLEYDSGKSLFYRNTEHQFEPEVAHLFRSAKLAGVEGIYMFQTSLENKVLPPRPVVYVAKASTPEHAREIHCRLWNLGYAPFLIVLLPNQIRVYNTFDYDPQLNKSKERGLLFQQPLLVSNSLRNLLADFSATSIDAGQIWQSKYAAQLDPKRRVDTRLLKNLTLLANFLVKSEKDPLKLEVAHALIGKYVYIRYLYDRKILSPEWLNEQDIDLDTVLGRYATVQGLKRLIQALENRFNGDIFPLRFDTPGTPKDAHVRLVASIFKGDVLTPDAILQKSLDFRDFEAYDFQYIPIETLSTIYELFLHAQGKGEAVGAYYTPEILADYVLSEVQSVKPLTRQMKILDPSCGSGVFLVLAYRRLIEQELAKRAEKEIEPSELKKILLESIYGVEREPDACSVAEFSLILTMLNYVSPPELHKNKAFRFPKLRNHRIFHCDFFDDNSPFWKSQERFDWVVGNPPWIELSQKNQAESNGEHYARKWMVENRKECPIARGRVVEAFSWRVTGLLNADGVVGIVHHATSLFNTTSKKYRQRFFQEHRVFRITNFANLRATLFGGRATAPAATFIYRVAIQGKEKPPIVHYGPLAINQISGSDKILWALTINESEIQAVSPQAAESGNARVWKLALWGTYRDERAIARLRHLFPTTLANLCKKKNWPPPAQGADLREILNFSELSLNEQKKYEYHPEIVDKLLLETDRLNVKPASFLSIPESALVKNNKYYVRKQGGDIGLQVIDAPHIFVNASWNHIIYSEKDFLVEARQIGIGSSKGQDHANYLRALTLYLRSSLVTYYIFFQVPEWGIFLGAKLVVLGEVKQIPVPDFTPTQVKQLAQIHGELVEEESRALSSSDLLGKDIRSELQAKIDQSVFRILSIPKTLEILATEFIETRLPLNQGKRAIDQLKKPPFNEKLLAYGEVLRDKLDDSVTDGTYHKVSICPSTDLIECQVEICRASKPFPVVIEQAKPETAEILSDIRRLAGEQQSQWVYIQRGIRVFDGPHMRIYKPSRLSEWTQTQALNDAADIIGEILDATGAS